jgi:hypothetical protein
VTEPADHDLLAMTALIFRAAGSTIYDEAEYDLAVYRLPQKVLGLQLGSLLRLVLLLGSIKQKGTQCGKNMSIDINSPAAAAQVCQSAIAMLKDWPSPLYDVLKKMLPLTDTNNPDTWKLNQAFGRFYHRLFLNLSHRKFSFLLDTVHSVVMEQWHGFMSRTEVQDTLGLSYTMVKALAQARFLRYVRGYNCFSPGLYHFVRDDVVKIIQVFKQQSVLRRKYTRPGELISLRHALGYLGADTLPDIIQAVANGDLLPVAYAKLCHGISGYLFPSCKIAKYDRRGLLPERFRIQNFSSLGLPVSKTMQRLFQRHELNRLYGPHRRSILKYSQLRAQMMG